MEPIVTPGLVLKETRYKESDRIITILTPGLGVISASAQSSLRLKNKLFSACGLFCYSEFVLLPGRNMYTVREAESKNVFHGIASSIEGMSLAMYMAEMAAALSPTGEEAEKELRLLLNCLYMLSEKKADLRVIKAVFELRTLSEQHRERIRAMEEGGSITYWQVIFEANSFTDLLDRQRPSKRLALCSAAFALLSSRVRLCFRV